MTTLSEPHIGDGEAEVSPGEENMFPLSFAQQRFWFLHQLDPDSPVYNLIAPARLRGNLNVEALRKALAEIVQRHESLRTNFTVIDGSPMQVVAPSVPLELPMIDLSCLPFDHREAEAKRLLGIEMRRPFDLTHHPMLRAQLFRLSAADHILSLNMPHIVSDGWSMAVFFNELAVLYQDFFEGKPASLPELPLQYVDFAMWQRESLQGETFQQHMEYWKKQLAGAPVLLELPTDRPRSAASAPRGTQISFSLGKPLSQSLKALAREEGGSMFMLLLAAFKVLMARYANVDDIVIGSPVGMRDSTELEGLIGCFINTLALRTDLSGNPPFREVLARVRETALDAYDHQETPLEQIIDELKVPRIPGRSPLFQVLFQYLSEPAKLSEFCGISVEMLPPETGTSKFDLTLEVIEKPDGLAGYIEYDSDLFEEASIHRMAGHYRTLLEAVVRDPAQKIRHLPLLTREEESELLKPTPAAMGASEELTIPALFEKQVKAAPNSVAVIFENQQLTYRELNERASHLAGYLKMLDVGPETLVGVCMERSLEMVVAVFGILKAGGAYVPLDPNYPKERLRFMMEDSQAPVLLTQKRMAGMIPSGQAKIVCLDSEWETVASKSAGVDSNNAFRPRINSENLAYVIYTSGSTGQPKGVMITHGSVCNHAAWMQQTFPLNPEDRVLQRTAFSFDVSVWEIFGPLLYGAQLVLAPSENSQDTRALAEMIAEQKISLLQAVPSLLRVLLDEPKFKQCTSLKYVLVGGESLPPALVARFKSIHNAKLINAYGPTETTIDATWHVCSTEDASRASVPIGKPIAHTRAYVLDQYLQPVPLGVPGELHLGGRGLARGYWRRPELTAEKFIANPFVTGGANNGAARLYKTGDLVRFLPDGNIDFLGRVDHQVKIRGFRVELGEIESVLCQFPDIREAAVMAREENRGEKRLVAYLAAEISSDHMAELRAWLKNRLPDYMVPSVFVTLKSFPLSPNGKVDRSALPEPEFKSDAARYAPPRTPLEQQLAQIWSDVLGVKQVGINDNFFELGGHSLLATQVAARMRAVSGKDLPLRVFFQSPTIAGLGVVLKNATEPLDSTTPSITPLARKKNGGPLQSVKAAMHAVVLLFQSFLAELVSLIPESSLTCLSLL